MKEAVHEIISASQLEAKTEAKWVQVVGAAHSQVSMAGGGALCRSVREKSRKRRISDVLFSSSPEFLRGEPAAGGLS